MGDNASSRKSRIFDQAWTRLEKQHAWRITETEVHNPRVAKSLLPFAWQDYDNRRAAAFRERHRLTEVIAGAANDWEAALRLRNWVFTHMPFGKPCFDELDPLAVMEASLAGGTFWCTYLSYIFVAAAGSVGLNARHLGIDRGHDAGGPGIHHGIADIWTNHYRKWVAFDVTYDCHYEFDSIPLNAEELSQRWLANQGAGVNTFIGPQGQQVALARPARATEHESSAYLWYYINCDADPLHRRGQSWPDPAILLQNEFRKSHTWYTGQNVKHCRYENGSFLFTERYADAYPDLNCVQLELVDLSTRTSQAPYFTPVKLWLGSSPNFSHFNLRLDGGEAQRFDGTDYNWRLHPGHCSLEIRTVNYAGLEGPRTTIAVDVQPDADRKPEWPRSASPSN